MSERVFVVTSGEYSDYGIEGIFDNSEQADILAKLTNGRVTEWKLNQIPRHPKGKLKFTVHIENNGDIAFAEQETLDLKPGTQVETYMDSLIVVCWARDREHAIKIAGDCRRKHLATKQDPQPKGQSDE